MTEDLIPDREDLKNKPLVEAIFELQWALQSIDSHEVDPGFRILLGRLYDRIREEYPTLENLPQSLIPEELTGRLVRHRFRVSKEGWPLLQVGPGVLSVNETEGYTWGSFRPRLIQAMKALFDSYPTDIHPLQITRVLLRYMDAIPFDGEKPLLQFLRESLHTTVELDPRLFQYPQDAASPSGLNLSLVFKLPELPGAVATTFTLGRRNEKPSIIWDTQILAGGDEIPKMPEDYESWLERAHDLAGQWFRTLSRGSLYESFRSKA
ncbi:MAG: TIGR04255 family protein [Blastocatellia bacterium]